MYIQTHRVSVTHVSYFTQHQYTEVQPKQSVRQTTVPDHTKVVYAQVDKKKLKPVDPDGPPPSESLLVYLSKVSVFLIN